MSAAQFDNSLESWLLEGSKGLKEIVLQHAVTQYDRNLIERAFHVSKEEDVLLSEEFGVDPLETEFKEGKDKLKLHLIKERNRHLTKLAKDQWQKEASGNVRCSVCDFSFSDAYGEIGEGYIETHHLLPLAQLTAETIAKVSDLAPVCANCHRMIHRHRPWLSISELKAALKGK
jgi:putative restriction endonuclease